MRRFFCSHMLNFVMRIKRVITFAGPKPSYMVTVFIYSERNDLMLRNSELSQELQTVKKILEDEKSALEKDINGRMETENIQRQKYDQLQESCDKLRKEVHFIQHNFVITQKV